MNIISTILRKLKGKQSSPQPEEIRIKDVVLYSEENLEIVLRTEEIISEEKKEFLIETIKDCRGCNMNLDCIEVNLILSPKLYFDNLRVKEINNRVLLVVI